MHLQRYLGLSYSILLLYNSLSQLYFLIFGFLFHKKSYRVLFIVSYILTSGFGRDVKRRLNIGITRVLLQVINLVYSTVLVSFPFVLLLVYNYFLSSYLNLY